MILIWTVGEKKECQIIRNTRSSFHISHLFVPPITENLIDG